MDRKLIFSLLLLVGSCSAQIMQQVIGNTPGASGVAAIAYVGSGGADCSGNGVCSATYSPVAGHHIIVSVAVGDVTAAQNPSVTDDAGTPSTYSSTFIDQTLNSNYYFAEFYVCSVNSGASHIKVTPGANASGTWFAVTEYSGGLSSSCADTHSSGASGAPSGGVVTAPSITPGAGNNEIISGWFVQLNNSTDLFGTSGSYVLRKNQPEAIFTGAEMGITSQIVGSTSGSYSPAATQVNLSYYYSTSYK